MNELTNTTEPQIAYSECYVLPLLTFYNADNMAIMKTYKDKEFDLAIVDPPYGIGMGGGKLAIVKKIINNLLGVIVASQKPIISQN